MAIAPPGFFVDAPKIPPIPKMYGLLKHVEPIVLDDQHAWAGGVEWEQDLCSPVESFVTNCPPASGHEMEARRGLEFCHADPFVIQGSFDCSTTGRTLEDAAKIARRRLVAWESYELEKVFWTGQSANGPVSPSLTSGNDYCELAPINLSPEGALEIMQAIGFMEEALTDVVPGGGVIHGPFGLTAYLKAYDLLTLDDGKYYSPSGFPYILGAGYTGSGPGNVEATAGTTWIYGTGPIGIWRGDIFMNPGDLSSSINRYRNDITVFAERFYAVGFSCALYAIPVQL